MWMRRNPTCRWRDRKRKRKGDEKMLDPKNLANGQEHYEKFRSRITKKPAVQYDYRDINGELFSCVKSSLEKCRAARDKWLEQRRKEQA